MLRILMERVGIGNVNGVVALKAHMGELNYELIKV